ncbi:MAG: hypothetical protein WD883_02960 [Candidatus Colwellbacteria bacterium]
MKLLYIFILGVSILLGAIILNALASRLGLMNWFEFFKNPGAANTFSYIWLLVIYPLGLGVIGYYVAKLLDL